MLPTTQRSKSGSRNHTMVFLWNHGSRAHCNLLGSILQNLIGIILKPQRSYWHLRFRSQSAPSSIPSTTSSPLLIIRTSMNKRLDTSGKKKKNWNKTSGACRWPTWKRPRSAGERRELWKPAAGTKAKVWSLVGWRSSSLEKQVFYNRAKQGAPRPPPPHHRYHPPEDDRCFVHSLQRG